MNIPALDPSLMPMLIAVIIIGGAIFGIYYAQKKYKIFSGMFKPKRQIIYYPVSNKTIGIHASNVLPRWEDTNPLFHQTANRSLETAKRGVDLLGIKPKKPNTALWYAILIVMVVVVVFLIIYAQSTEQAKDAAKAAAGQTVKLANGTIIHLPPAPAPKGGGIIQLPGLGG